MAWLATVSAFEGTPYVHQGRLPGVGMDCPAPMICAAWTHGLKPRGWDITGYSPHPDGTLERLCGEHMMAIDPAEAAAGDVLLCAFKGERWARHLGVLLPSTPGRRYWLHAESVRFKRVVVNRLVLAEEGMRLIGAYAVPGVGP